MLQVQSTYFVRSVHSACQPTFENWFISLATLVFYQTIPFSYPHTCIKDCKHPNLLLRLFEFLISSFPKFSIFPNFCDQVPVKIFSFLKDL